MSLTDFLLARITEDEAVAQYGDGGLMDGAHFSAGRVLAECEAKRQILKRAHESNGYWGRDIERAMLTPYLDHPDCLDEWWQ